MATVLEKGDDINKNEVMSCTLCKQELKNPKLLACQHSFCTQCLVQHRYEDDEGKPFCCPTCHVEIELEDDTIASIPDNYLYDIVKEADGQDVYLSAKCTPCNEGNKVITATHKCLDCRDTLCQHCSEYHCRLTITKHHVVVTLNDLREGKFKEEFSKRKVLYCAIHSTDKYNVPMSGYCDICKSLVCADCMQGDHKGHDFAKIHLVRETQQASSDDQFSNLKRSYRDQDKRIGNIEKAITDTKQKWNQQEAEIYNTAAELYILVDKIKEGKLTELKSLYEQEFEYLNGLLNEERSKQKSLQATIAFTEMFLEKCSDSDYLHHEDDVRTRMESSQRGLSREFKRNMVFNDKRITESIKRAIGDTLGKIKIQERYIPHKCRIGQVKEIFKKEIEIVGVYGLSYNIDDKEIFLAGQSEHGGIFVLNEEGCFKRMIRCENANRAFDGHVKSSHFFYTVYVKNSRKVVMTDHRGKVFKSIMLPADDQENNGLLGLVVDEDNDIYVSSNKMDRIYNWNLDDNKLLTVISSKTGHALTIPSYLCLTPIGELVVSNCGSSNTSIQVYSKEGELQWQYDGKEEGCEIKKPKGVCCDEDGYIYFVDQGKCQIQVIHDKKLVGTIPMDNNVKDKLAVPMILTPGGNLIYSYGTTLVKISFWE